MENFTYVRRSRMSRISSFNPGGIGGGGGSSQLAKGHSLAMIRENQSGINPLGVDPAFLGFRH